MITIDCESDDQELKAAKFLAFAQPTWGVVVYTDVVAVEGNQVWNSDQK